MISQEPLTLELWKHKFNKNAVAANAFLRSFLN